MSRESLVILLGLLVLFTPSLGIPSDWKTYSLIVIGVVLVVVGYSLRRSMYLRTLERSDGERANDVFVENNSSVPRAVTSESAED